MRQVVTSLSAAVLPFLFGLAGHATASPPYYIPSALEVPLSRAFCYDCNWCDGGGAYTEQWLSLTIFIGFDQPKYCGPGLCQGNVIWDCQEGEEDALDREQMLMVWDAVAAGDALVIARLISEKPKAVWLNSERRSIQFRSCTSEAPIANLPLSDELMSVLE